MQLEKGDAEKISALINALVEHGFDNTPLVYIAARTHSQLMQAKTKGSIRRARHWAQRARRRKGRG